jgi:hypothetical protein
MTFLTPPMTGCIGGGGTIRPTVTFGRSAATGRTKGNAAGMIFKQATIAIVVLGILLAAMFLMWQRADRQLATSLERRVSACEELNSLGDAVDENAFESKLDPPTQIQFQEWIRSLYRSFECRPH